MRLLGLSHAHPCDLHRLWNGSHAATFNLFNELVNLGNSLVIGYCKLSRLETMISAAWSLSRFGRHDRIFITQNSLAWQLKSRRAERYVRQHLKDTDITLLSHALFTPYSSAPLKPYAVFTDYNFALRYKHSKFLPPAPWANDCEQEKIFSLEKELFHHAEKVFVPTRYVQQSLIADYGLPEEKAVVVGYGKPSRFTKQISQRDWTAQRLILIGEPKSFERKGGFELLAAFKRLRSRLPNATLTMIGPSPELTGDFPGLHALGFIQDRQQVETLLAQSTCFVMPTRQEPFGAVFLEAMAARLPVAATLVDGVPEIVLHGETGLLVPPGDVEALSDALYQILTRPEMAQEMGEAGFQRERDLFSWAKVARRINDALDEKIGLSKGL